ncbi:Pollen ole e 1 allergen and extensin family protein [Thalictrum thalictroides]|uniref:Pollen ole e 1 allergen and extensin family protein n=1 Tax=Thalictrum thalictroides TaxID=46969 RepID=A0A7J6VLW3_THATH|nr:Pollen ole e 1 allergen and extensin family protein [Thalictrum thalictroides]
MAMKMVLGIMVASLLVNCFSISEAWKDEPKKIHVGGKVLCQDCTGDWNDWVQGSKPIKGCRVSVTCMDDRGRVMHYASDETDEQGDFDMIVDKNINGKELKPELCSVRLVSSPDNVCNLLTDFAGGRSGVKLTRPSHIFRDLVKYTLGPFFFTTPMCDEPDTTGY